MAKKKSLETLLRMRVPTKTAFKGGKPAFNITPDFRIKVMGKQDGGTHIIVHPIDHDGDTLDFVVKGNELTQI